MYTLQHIIKNRLVSNDLTPGQKAGCTTSLAEDGEVMISNDKPSIQELQKKGNKYIDPKSKHGDYLTIAGDELRYFDN